MWHFTYACINIYIFSILVMDDVVRISSSLHAILRRDHRFRRAGLCQKNGYQLTWWHHTDGERMDNGDEIPCFSGSKAEGLRFKSSDEDWMYISRDIKVVPSDSFVPLYDVNTQWVFMMENEMTKPGFTLLRLVEIGYGKNGIFFELGHFRKSLSVDMLNGRYVPSKLWRETHVHGIHGHEVFLHGPCSSGFLGDKEYDWAHCLKCDIWPQNARASIKRLHQSSWPSNHTIRDIVSDGVLFVPIGAKQSFFEDTEWRMSFSLAEKRLIHSMNYSQFLCYGLLKVFLKEAIDANEDVKGLMCSYFLKTALFWEISESPSQWNPSSLLSCFWKCFRRLIQWVISSYCPNFFIPENNMFLGKIEGENQNKLFKHLRALYHDGYTCLFKCSSFASYPMSMVLNGCTYICSCGVCVARTIVHEENNSSVGSKCFVLNEAVICLLLDHFMQSADTYLVHYFTRAWMYRLLTQLCVSQPRHSSTGAECNKFDYQNHVRRLRVLKRCRRGPGLPLFVPGYEMLRCWEIQSNSQIGRTGKGSYILTWLVLWSWWYFWPVQKSRRCLFAYRNRHEEILLFEH